MARVLVCGSNGLIGRHLVTHLIKQGHTVLCIDDLSNSDPIPEWEDRVTRMDLTHPHAPITVANCKAEVVYSLACHAYEGLSQFVPSGVSQSVLTSTINVLIGAINSRTCKRLVNYSSMARFGKGMQVTGYTHLPFQGMPHADSSPIISETGPPFGESKHLPWPEDVYGVAKVAAERSVEILCKLHNIEYVHLVPHNVYGEANLKSLSDPYRGVLVLW